MQKSKTQKQSNKVGNTVYPSNKIKKVEYKSNTQSQLNSTIINQQEQIDALKAKAETAEQNDTIFKSVKGHYDKAAAAYKVMQYDIDDAWYSAATANNRVTTLESRVSELESGNTGNSEQISGLSDQVDTLQSCLTTLQSTTNDINHIVEVQQSQIDQNTEQIQINTQNISVLTGTVSNNADSVAEHKIAIEQINAQVDENTLKIAELEQNGGGTSEETIEKIRYLSEQVETNTNEIECLKTEQSLLSENATNLSDNQDNLQNQVTQNHTNIATLQEQVEINTQKINALQNGSSESTELDLIDLTAQVEQNTQDIQELQNQNTQTEASLAELFAFKARFQQTPDPHYMPKSYSDYPAGTILQSYACYERELELTNTSTITLPNAYFLAELGGYGNVKLTIDLTVNADVLSVTTYTYLNSTEIDSQTQSIPVTNGALTLTYQINDITLNTETKQNTIYSKLVFSNLPQVTVNKVKIELFAPNADLINIVDPYNVEFIDNQYYVSDCTSGRAMLATIPCSEMYNMSSLSFQDLGFDAQSLSIGKGAILIGDEYRFDNTAYFYNRKDNTVYYHSPNYELTTKSTSALYADWLPLKSSHINFVITYYQFSTRYAIIYYDNGKAGYGNYSTLATNTVKVAGAKFMDDINKFGNITTFASISKSGDVVLTHNKSNAELNNINLGYGTTCRVYFDTYTSTRIYSLKVYIKRFDKIIEYKLSYNSTNGFTITSTTEIGTYDDFFLGVSGDYFAVRNGKLSHHFFPEEAEEEQLTE